MIIRYLRHYVQTMCAAAALAVALTPIARADDEAPMKKGSIPVSHDGPSTSLARISLTDAVKAALASDAGTAVSAKLEEDDGFLVWEVAVIDARGKTVDLDVDAGNGKILAVEEADHEGKGAAEDEDRD